MSRRRLRGETPPLRRLAAVRGHLLDGRGAASEEEQAAKKPPARDHTPGERQVLARRLGVKYGPVAFVRGVPWIGAGGEETEALVLEHQDKIQLRSTDVWIATYPKCGTTWTHQIALLLLNDGESSSWGGDPHGFKTGELLASWPEVTYAREGEKFLDALQTVPDPRVMKTHAPYFLLPGRPGGAGTMPCKAIYVTRNPKDACVSMLCAQLATPSPSERRLSAGQCFSNACALCVCCIIIADHAQQAWGYDGNWDQWYTLWMAGEVEFGSWFDHTIDWWNAARAEENDGKILWVTYEQLQQDNAATIARIAAHLEVELTEELLGKVQAESAFSNMQTLNSKASDPHGQTFYRKGEVGDWRNHFSEQQSQDFDRVYGEKLAGLGLTFDFGGGVVM